MQDENGSGQLTSGSAPYYRTALSYIPEEPWNDSTQFNLNVASNQALVNQNATNIIGGGGGASGVYSKPSFQTSLTPIDNSRDLPDVSFLSGNGLYQASWVICADGNCQTANNALVDGTTVSGVGGTSAAAPTFAGMLALVEQKTGSRLGQADYVLYQLASTQYSTVFHDATTGDNSVVCQSGTPNCGSNNFLSGYNAGANYDQATGLGSVDAAQLVSNWGNAALGSTSTSFNINGSSAAVNLVHGTSLTFNVAVTPSSATGAAAIVDTANEVSGGPQNNGQVAIPLTGGTGSINYNGLPGGTHTVYARYGGDSSDASSSSTPAINVTISPEASTTALAVNAYSAVSPNPPITNLSAIPYGSFIAADASIYGSAEGASRTQGLATGTVKLTDGSTVVATSLAVSSGNAASYMIPNPSILGSQPVFSIGTHNLTASYSGDASYNPSASTAVPFTVVKGSTQMQLVLSSTSINSESSTNLTLSVGTSSFGAYPTGGITLSANGSTLATITNLQSAADFYNGTVAANGFATINGSQLAAGSNTITATYSGDSNYLASSGTVNVSVAASGFSLTNSGAIAVTAGASSGNTSTITIAPTNGFLGAINLSCAVTTSAAQSPATCSIPASAVIATGASVTVPLTVNTSSSTTAGTYVVTVSGTDAGTGKISARTVVNVTVGVPVGAAGFTLANSGNITVAPGATTGDTSTITVTPVNGFTGAVSLSCAVSGSSSSTAPTCTVPSSVSISGSSAATATLTVTTTANSARMSLPKWLEPAGGVALATLLFFGIPARRRAWCTLMGLLIAVFTISAVGCGGGGSSTTSSGGGGTGPGGTTAGTYSVTVSAVDTATSKITATTVVSVTVQ